VRKLEAPCLHKQRNCISQLILQLAADVESKRIVYHVVVLNKVVRHRSKGLRYDIGRVLEMKKHAFPQE
jgi:hypothetical protein